MTSPLVTGDWLEKNLDDPKVKILEIVASKDKTQYREGHIPGAIWCFWKEICWHDSDRQFVSPEELAKRFGALGIKEDDTVVLYGEPVQYGTYAFWAFTMGGHKDLRILDGTRTKWTAEGRPLTKDLTRITPVEYKPGTPDESMRVGRDDVRDNLGKEGRFLLDVRSPEEYSGERVMEYPKFDHGAERNGRIPGAVHLYFKNLINDDNTFKSAVELKAVLEKVGATPDKEIVAYCRLSHRATLAWTAMKFILGYENAKIYDGSWTEWGSIIGFPVEK